MTRVPDYQTIRDVTGWVYFAGAYEGDELKFVKIGYTSGRNPNHRVREVAEGVPQSIRLLAAVPGCLALEHHYHEEFAKWRERGEWFRPCGDILCRVDTIKAMPGSWKERYGTGKRRKGKRAKVRSTVDDYIANNWEHPASRWRG